MPYWAHPQIIKRLQAYCKRFFYGALHTICTQVFLIINLESNPVMISARWCDIQILWSPHIIWQALTTKGRLRLISCWSDYFVSKPNNINFSENITIMEIQLNIESMDIWS